MRFRLQPNGQEFRCDRTGVYISTNTMRFAFITGKIRQNEEELPTEADEDRLSPEDFDDDEITIVDKKPLFPLSTWFERVKRG